MNDEVLSREAIARQAEQAAMRSAASGRVEANPHAPNTEAWLLWDTAFRRYYRIHTSAEDTESGA